MNKIGCGKKYLRKFRGTMLVLLSVKCGDWNPYTETFRYCPECSKETK